MLHKGEREDSEAVSVKQIRRSQKSVHRSMPGVYAQCLFRKALLPVTLGSSALAAVVLGVGAYLGARIVTPAKSPDERVTVWAVEPASLTISPVGLNVWLHGPDAALEGNYSFIFDKNTGHARLGPVTDRIQDGAVSRVSRPVIAVDRGELRAGSRGRVTGWWYTTPEELGYETEHVRIPVPGGELHGWVVTPPDAVAGRWAIHVHGRGALPQETLRGVPAVARAGVTSLIVNYRNDPNAPRGIRGRYGLGLAERHDIDAAIRWALTKGATRLTLVGWSMGGTTVLLSATRGPYRGWIDGLVLDTPGINWSDIIRTQARLAGVPKFFGDLGRYALQHNWIRGAVPEAHGTDVASLNPARFARDLMVPVLIHAGPDDTFVPWFGAKQLAECAPKLVQLRTARGEHVKVWNVDPHAWESATERFVRGLGDPAAKLSGTDRV